MNLILITGAVIHVYWISVFVKWGRCEMECV